VIDDREDVTLDEVRELAVEIADEEQASSGRIRTLLTDIASNAIGGALGTGLSSGLGRHRFPPQNRATASPNRLPRHIQGARAATDRLGERASSVGLDEVCRMEVPGDAPSEESLRVEMPDCRLPSRKRRSRRAPIKQLLSTSSDSLSRA
jgi:hypothetical protein